MCDMDSLRLCLSCAGRKPSSGKSKRGQRVKAGQDGDDGQPQEPKQRPDLVMGAGASSHQMAAEPSEVSEDSLEKVLEHAGHDDRPDTPGYWRNRGIGDVDTPPVRRRVMAPHPAIPSCSSSSNSVGSFIDSCTTANPLHNNIGDLLVTSSKRLFYCLLIAFWPQLISRFIGRSLTGGCSWCLSRFSSL